MNASVTFKKKMVIHSCTSESFSGLERYVVELIQAQSAMPQLSIVFFGRPDTRLWKAVQAISGVKLLSGTADLKAHICQHHSTHDGIVLHMHHAGEWKVHGPLILWAKWFRRDIDLFVILQFHLWINQSKLDPWHWFMYRYIDKVWCSSSAAKKQLAQILPISESKLKIVDYGRDLPLLNEYAKNQNTHRQMILQYLSNHFAGQASVQPAVVIVCVSRIEKMKGIEELVKAYGSWRHENKNFCQTSPTALVIVGDASPQNPEAEAYRNRLQEKWGADQGVHWLGHREDYLAWMAGSDLYVLPSYEECMALSLLDALMLGKPIIGTNSGGTPSVVLEGKNGALAEPADVKSLQDALQRAMAVFGTPLWQQWGRTSQQMGQTFDRARVFQHILTHYAESSASRK